MLKKLVKFVPAVSVVLPALAFAAPPDLSSLTDAVDFSTVITGILAVGAALAGLYVVILGVVKLINFIRGGK